MIHFRRIRFTSEIANKLEDLSRKTGLTPNYICRMALCLSLEEPGLPFSEDFTGDVAKEIDRHVLFGRYDPLFLALVRERAVQDGLDTSDDELILNFLRAHIHRGVLLLHKSVKQLQDIADLIPSR